MNEKQRTVLMVVACVVVAMLAYPPFEYRGTGGRSATAGYAFLLSPPPQAAMDVGTLLIQWFGVAIAGGIAFVLARGR